MRGHVPAVHVPFALKQSQLLRRDLVAAAGQQIVTVTNVGRAVIRGFEAELVRAMAEALATS